MLHGPLRRRAAQTPSTKNTLLVSALGRISSPPAGRMDHSATELPKPHHSELYAPHSANMLQSTSPRAASTSPKIARRPVLFFMIRGCDINTTRNGQAYTRIKHSKHQRRGLRLPREPIGLNAPVLTGPDRLSLDSLGLWATCTRSSCRCPFLVVLSRKKQAVIVECLGFVVWRDFSHHARYRTGFSNNLDPASASNKLLCSFSADDS